MTISVCTVARGRDRHLENLILGLRRSARPPRDLVVAVMQGRRLRLPEASFPVRQVVLGKGETSLARARNAAARLTTGRLLAFLDADCIPSPTLLDDYVGAATLGTGVFMGEVGFLARGATDHGLDFARFGAEAVQHESRPTPAPQALEPVEDGRAFSALNFAIRAADFAALGGFDEAYAGSGGEEADFGRMLAQHHVPLWWLGGATAYHQHHPQHMPPVHRLDAVLADAARFERKWGQPAMEQWLRAFALMGLVKREGDHWVKLREPTESDLALTRQQEHQPYASSTQVLHWLEERAVRRIDSGKKAGKSTAAA